METGTSTRSPDIGTVRSGLFAAKRTAAQIAELRNRKDKNIQEQRAQQMSPELVIQIAGIEEDFKGWKRQQQKNANLTVLNVRQVYAVWGM